MRKSVPTTALLLVAALLVVSISVIPSISGFNESESLVTGPYVNEVVFRVIANHDQRILALQAGEIEMDSSFFDSSFYDILDSDPDIDILRAMRNGYGHITINCRDYPLNISGLRRAFAFAFDKTRVTAEIFNGLSQEHDSLVPFPNSWCAEDEFDWHYYTNQSDIGNQILDDLGFEINEVTGFRHAPNGEPFNIIIDYAASSPEIAGGTAQIGVDALHSLHIDAKMESPNEYPNPIDNHGNYDMVLYAINFYSNDIDWLAYEYWSEYANVTGENPTNFRNATYDGWRDQLLHGTTYEDVYEASAEMQKILHYNVPRLVVYENVYLQAYRNDKFTGHAEDLGRHHITGQWTMRNIHKLDGSFGGTIPISIYFWIDSFNFILIDSTFSGPYYSLVTNNLYSSLYKRGPDLNPWPDLATNMITETHAENSAVPNGHTRFTFDIIKNATWSDGVPLTANDVAFTYVYQYESAAFGNQAGTELGDLVASYAPNQYRVVLEFSTESYWHFSDFAFDNIIPIHIFNNSGGIGYEECHTWDPVFNVTHPHVTCGPYIFSDYEAGEFYRLKRNPLFHYAASPSVPTNETTTTTTTTNQTQPEMNWSWVFSISIGSVSGIVIVYCVVSIIQNRRNVEDL